VPAEETVATALRDCRGRCSGKQSVCRDGREHQPAHPSRVEA
jgi:hypothetical protein